LGDTETTPLNNQLGSPGQITRQFKAITKGSTDVLSGLQSASEQDTTPEKTFDAT
jgi:predicted secreted protein